MKWFNVDSCCDYLEQGTGKKPSRKVVYAMVNDGMRVARLGDSGRRLMFCAEWVDAYLVQRARGAQPIAVDVPRQGAA